MAWASPTAAHRLRLRSFNGLRGFDRLALLHHGVDPPDDKTVQKRVDRKARQQQGESKAVNSLKAFHGLNSFFGIEAMIICVT